MQLIKKIEINYLRSLYSATIDRIGDLNVIFGRNDSGKSNLLRALNLFFNDEVDSGRELEFDLDMSDQRKQEARDAKGRQFIWIKITFAIPANYRGALGNEIAIKRQWNRDGGLRETVFPSLDSAGKQARLTRFLNDIDFTYIPAIKDLSVYADLIERMYGAAAYSEPIKDATRQFVDAIQAQTTSLSEQLAALFGTPARLAPPTAMGELFRNLDFAHGEDGHSLLRQKGDGVKARHLPELLRFINESEARRKFYLWGFEEPENSLDLGAAEDEARRFASLAARPDTQVFITSHSPAFYLAEGQSNSEVRRFFITKQIKNSKDVMEPNNAASLIDEISDAEQRMENAGLLQLPFIIRRMKEHHDILEATKEEASELRAALASLRKPTLFVEGKHDVSLFTEALNRIGAGEEISVKALGGTPQSPDALLNAVLHQGGLTAAAPSLFLFDDDRSGRGAFRQLCKSTPATEPSSYGTTAHVWLLQKTEEFRRFSRRNDIKVDQCFFTVEFLFPVEEAAKLCFDLVSKYQHDEIDEWQKMIHGDYWSNLGQKRCLNLLDAEPGSPDWLYARGVPDRLKQEFAKGARERSFSTGALDAIAIKVQETLLGFAPRAPNDSQTTQVEQA